MLRSCTRSLLKQEPSLLFAQCSAGPSRRFVRSDRLLSKVNKPSTSNSIIIRTFSQTTYKRHDQKSSSTPSTTTTTTSDQSSNSINATAEETEPKLSLTFTCTANQCGHRSSHQFTKRSYERGIVLVQCPSCKNRHLIADHLGWFTDSKDQPKTVEEIVAAHGGRIRTGIQYEGQNGYETMEILSDSDDKNSKQ